MLGVAVWDASKFHPACQDVQVLEIAGKPYLWCKGHRIFADLQAVAPKFARWEDAAELGGAMNAKEVR